MTPLLEFRSVGRTFNGDKPALDRVSFTLQAGEVAGVLGRNGAGKTTLLRIATGMLFPTVGSVRVFGLSPTADPVTVKRRIGYVAEDQQLPSRASIAELIGLHKYLFPTWDDRISRELLDRFALRTSARIAELSKGQARQVALMLAVSHRPGLLILDEPAGGLDPAARREFLETAIQLLNRDGTTILFSSHHMTDVERLSARILLFDRGQLRIDQPLDRIHEGHCIAILPDSAVPYADTLERLPGCLRVHPVGHTWHAVFEGSPETTGYLLRERFGLEDVSCRSVPLEELFIELLGNERHVAQTFSL